MNHAYYEIILHIKNHFGRFSFVQVGLLGQSLQDVTQKQKNKQTMDMNHEQLRKTRQKLSRPSLEINVIVPTLTLLWVCFIPKTVLPINPILKTIPRRSLPKHWKTSQGTSPQTKKKSSQVGSSLFPGCSCLKASSLTWRGSEVNSSQLEICFSKMKIWVPESKKVSYYILEPLPRYTNCTWIYMGCNYEAVSGKIHQFFRSSSTRSSPSSSSSSSASPSYNEYHNHHHHHHQHSFLYPMQRIPPTQKMH